MSDIKILNDIIKHIGDKDSLEEKKDFNNWLLEEYSNQLLLSKIQSNWDEYLNRKSSFSSRFNKKNLKKSALKILFGQLVGFSVSLFVANSFNHYINERRGLKNLFGLVARKKILVNDVPEWLQFTISVILGFIILELINYIIEHKKHIVLWKYIKFNTTKH